MSCSGRSFSLSRRLTANAVALLALTAAHNSPNGSYFLGSRLTGRWLYRHITQIINGDDDNDDNRFFATLYF